MRYLSFKMRQGGDTFHLLLRIFLNVNQDVILFILK